MIYWFAYHGCDIQAWTLLVEYMESREQKLKAAEELHRFNRDVAEHEQSVAEKLNGMPNDLGR